MSYREMYVELCGREGAPYREAEEIVCGAGVKECTVQRGRVECVRCEKVKSTVRMACL